MGEPEARQCINILGISLHPMRFMAAADLLEQWIAERLPRIVCFPGSDMLAASQRNTNLGSALNGADLTATDGMMLVRLCRWFGATQAERVYGPAVMLELCRRSPGLGYRHFFYGGKPGVVATLAARLQEQFPGLSVVGTISPPFRPLTESELAEDIRLINESQADVVLDRVRLTKAGAVGHRKPQPSARAAAACRGRSVRLSCRFRSPSPPLGARSRRGVALPPLHAATPLVAALRGAAGPVPWSSHLAGHPLAQVSHLRCRQRGSVIQSEAVIASAVPARPYLALGCSRLIDFCVATLVGIMVLPVIVLAIIAIKLVDPGPALCIPKPARQRRPAVQIFQAPQHAFAFRRLAARLSGIRILRPGTRAFTATPVTAHPYYPWWARFYAATASTSCRRSGT